MSLKDIDIGIKKIKIILINDIEKQLRFLGISYDKIYTSEEIENGFDVNRKYKRNQVLDVLMNECENDEAGSLLNDIKIRKKNLKKFIRECAFDFTNKFCAIRLLEERNLISPTIKKFKEYGDKSEVQKNLSRISYALLDKDPYDGLKDAIEGTLRELSTQIKLLFELNDEHSLLFPEPKTIKEITKVLLDEIPLEDWHRDDFVGWTYQYFVEDEKEEIEQADNPEEIAAKTQVYTYDWIVKYIVNNTLGSYWNEIKSGKRPQQEVETIKLIDPSCGSGSFLTYAFDKYYELYVEEGKIPEEQIPNYIISKNIFGMDIDERAVQLAALNLYIKAKEKNRNTQIEKFNIICTDSRIKGEVNIDKYLMSISIDPKLRDVIENIVRKSFYYMQENNLLGSLMKVEDVINPIIDEYVGGRRRPSIREVEAKKEKILKQSDQTTMFKAEVQQLSLDSIEDIRYFESREEFVEYLRQKILDCVDYVVTKINKANDINSRIFAKDLSKGSNFIGAMMQKYEVVVGNPPYLYQRKMGERLKNVLYKHYSNSNRDIYAAFIFRMNVINSYSGYCALISPDTYITLSVYSNLRKWLLNNRAVLFYIQLGKNVFKTVNVSVGISLFQNLIGNEILSHYDGDVNNDKLLLTNKKTMGKKDILKIENAPFIFSKSGSVVNFIEENKKFEPNFGEVRTGIQTGDNPKRVMMRWEVPTNKVGSRWVYYAKGGGFNKYLGRADFVLDWSKEAQEYYKKSPSARIRESKYHFRNGITYSDITSNNRFSSRILPNTWLYDVKGSAIFPHKISIKTLLGILNTKVANYILMMLNPTVSFQPGDLKRFPLPKTVKPREEIIENIVAMIIKLKKELFSLDPLSELYNKNKYKLVDLNFNQILYKNYFYEIIIEEYQYLLDNMVFEKFGIYNELDNIIEKFGESTIKYPLISELDLIDEKLVLQFDYSDSNLLCCNGETLEQIETQCNVALSYIDAFYSKKFNSISINDFYPRHIKLNNNEVSLIINKIRNLSTDKGIDIIKIAEEVGIHPRSILVIMRKYNIVIKEDLKDIAKRYIQTLARKAFDDDKDGIVLLSEVINKIHDELDKTFGENASSIETEIVNIIGKSIEKWLRDDFAIDYVNNKGYDKKKDKYKEIKNPWEPLIWKGQSSKKNFTVFVWRYKITPDTELKIRSQYLDSEIDSYKNKIKELDERLLVLEGKEKSNLEKEKDEIFYILDDLSEYKEWIKENGVRLRGMWFNWE